MKATASYLLTAVFHTITVTIATLSFASASALPAFAQTTVPSSAAQAARMPQYASRLARPAKSPSSAASHRPRTSPPDSGSIYDNGPVNGEVDAFALNFGFVNTESVQLGGNVSGLSFWAWLFPGDTITSVQVSLGSAPFASDQFNGTVTLTQSSCFVNNFGFNVCLESGNFTAGSSGTWVTLQNASVPSGDPVYWDANSGVGCTSPGCPSQAEQQGVGTIPSEAFSMQGGGGEPTCFQAAGNLQILHSFSAQEGGDYPGASGVVMDNTGNLYGTTYAGGNHTAGFAYKLAHYVNWLLDPLFNFFGGDNGGQPTGAILGPNGSLYGGAQGGIQNCGTSGADYCGLVYNLRPKPNPCVTALCGWNENVPYRFTSETDGSGAINVSAKDQQGNLYGTTSTGGAHGAGTVFELSPSGGAWTKATLYSFTGGNDGTGPTQVLAGNDGNLYGVAGGGAFHEGVVFQLTPSGGQWIESVIHPFGFHGDAINPSNLVQDAAGNLYGIARSLSPYSPIFALSKAGLFWSYSEYAPQHSCQPEDFPYSFLSNLTIDADGNLYGTGAGGENVSRSQGTKSPGGQLCSYNFIFKARYDSNGWHYNDLYLHDNVIFPTAGSLAVDASGNLYGTTVGCGAYDAGTVWELSR